MLESLTGSEGPRLVWRPLTGPRDLLEDGKVALTDSAMSGQSAKLSTLPRIGAKEPRMAKNVWVSGTRKTGFAVKSEGAKRAASRHVTQREAIEAGKAIAKNRGAELIVQGTDSRIRSKDSYGPDPFPPRDREH